MALHLFKKWQGQPLGWHITKCRKVEEDSNFPIVLRWREAGGKAPDHFQIYFPEELVHVAGSLPLKMRGTIELARSGSYLGSYLSSTTKTSLELL